MGSRCVGFSSCSSGALECWLSSCGARVDTILIFEKDRHIVLDGLDFEMRDITDCRLVEDEHRNLYSVIISVKGFGRSEITLNLEEDQEMAKKIVGRIDEIVQQNKKE